MCVVHGMQEVILYSHSEHLRGIQSYYSTSMYIYIYILICMYVQYDGMDASIIQSIYINMYVCTVR